MGIAADGQGRSRHARKRLVRRARVDPAFALAMMRDAREPESARRVASGAPGVEWERLFRAIIHSARSAGDVDPVRWTITLVHLAWLNDDLALFGDLIAVARSCGIMVGWSAPRTTTLGPARKRESAWSGAARLRGPCRRR